jgi:5-methylcytosine-specific restriction endonuclease McrA
MRGLHPATLKYQAKVIRDADKKRLAGLHEAKKFDPKNYQEGSPECRLSVLERFSKVGVKPISYKQLRDRRSQFDRVKNTKFPIAPLTPCWVCKEFNAIHRHHVILLVNGGSVTGRNNIVYLCESCHIKIHPWMVPTRVATLSAADFELARAKNEAGYILERSARGKFSSFEDAQVLILDQLRKVFNILVDKAT